VLVVVLRERETARNVSSSREVVRIVIPAEARVWVCRERLECRMKE
jgi:hypothetical protein